MARLPVHWVPALLALMLAAPWGAAQEGGGGGPVADLSATAVSATSGVGLEAALWAFTSTGEVADADASFFLGPTPRVAPESFVLTAQALRVETEVWQSSSVVAVGLPSEPWTEVEDSTNATLVAAESRDSFSFFLTSLPGAAPPRVSLEADHGALRPTEDRPTAHTYFDSGRSPLRAPPGPSLEWDDGVEWSRVAVEGDFILMLWDWDARVSDASGSWTLRTGLTWTPTLPDVAGIRTVGESEERQAYLFVEGGRIEFTLPAGSSVRLLVGEGDLATGGSLVAEDPTGSLETPEGTREVSQGDLLLRGNLVGHASQISPSGFRVRIAGDPDEAVVAGETIQFPDLPAEAVWPALVAASLAALVLLGTPAGWLGHRWRLRRLLRRLEAAMEEGRYEEVATGTTRSLLRSRRHGADAHVLRTVALLRAGRMDEAEAALASWNGGPAAAHAYLQACVHAARNHAAKALEALRACLQEEPAMAREVAGNPMFTPLLRELRLEAAASHPREGYT